MSLIGVWALCANCFEHSAIETENVFIHKAGKPSGNTAAAVIFLAYKHFLLTECSFSSAKGRQEPQSGSQGRFCINSRRTFRPMIRPISSSVNPSARSASVI